MAFMHKVTTDGIGYPLLTVHPYYRYIPTCIHRFFSTVEKGIGETIAPEGATSSCMWESDRLWFFSFFHLFAEINSVFVLLFLHRYTGFSNGTSKLQKKM